MKPLLIPIVWLLSPILLPGQVHEDHKFTAADGVADAAFGQAIALDAGLAVVGAPGDDDLGAGSGSLYAYHVDPGTLAWKATAADGAAGDAFGTSVAMDAGRVAVGAPKDDDSGADSGAVYLFDTTTGAQLLKIVPADGQAGDGFGQSIALDGSLLAVGARWDDDLGSDSGSVYLFDALTGQQLHKILPSDGTTHDNFGGAVALDQGMLAVGSHGDDDLGFLSGSAYLFDTTTGAQLHKLLASDGGFNDFFGSAIAMQDGTVAVGAWADSVVFDHSGSAYLFDATTGIQQHKLVPADTWDRDHFAISLDLDGGIVALGADGDDDQGFSSGSAYLFDVQSGEQIHKLLASDGAALDDCGAAVAIQSGTLVVGAPGDDDAGSSSGSAFLFHPFLLSLDGSPGGPMEFRAAGASPSGQVALAYARGSGSHGITNPLTGNSILTDLSPLAFGIGATGVTDAQGAIVFPVFVPAAAAGSFQVQVLDGTTDTVSNPMPL